MENLTTKSMDMIESDGTYNFDYGDPDSSDIIIYRLWTWPSPAVWCCGILGNIFTIIVFSRKAFSQSLTSFLFRALAILDSIALLESLDTIFAMSNLPLITYSKWTCRFGLWCTNTCKTCASWVLVGISVERCICVCLPHRANSICTHRRGKLYLALIIIISLTVFSTSMLYYTSELVPKRMASYCIALHLEGSLLYYYNNIDPWISLALYSIVPFVIIIFLNICIIAGLIRSSRLHSSLTTGTENNAPSMTGLTFMLISISIVFVICTAPWCIYWLRNFIWEIDDEMLYQMNLLWALSWVLSQMNHSVNFIMYCISGSRFRHEFKMMFCKQVLKQNK